MEAKCRRIYGSLVVLGALATGGAKMGINILIDDRYGSWRSDVGGVSSSIDRSLWCVVE